MEVVKYMISFGEHLRGRSRLGLAKHHFICIVPMLCHMRRYCNRYISGKENNINIPKMHLIIIYALCLLSRIGTIIQKKTTYLCGFEASYRRTERGKGEIFPT